VVDNGNETYPEYNLQVDVRVKDEDGRPVSDVLVKLLDPQGSYHER
jgi:protocatechuate 3,4-dioxygenase beta subunit